MNLLVKIYKKRYDRHNETLWTTDFFNSVFCLVSCSSKIKFHISKLWPTQIWHFCCSEKKKKKKKPTLKKTAFRSGLPICHELWDIAFIFFSLIKLFQTNMWCDQAKSVWNWSNSVFIFLTNCMHHFHSYILQETSLKLINWFQRYQQLKEAKNNWKQKTFSALFGSILKSIFLTSDRFCFITSHIMTHTPVLSLNIRWVRPYVYANVRF